MRVVEHEGMAELQRLAKGERDSRVRLRLQGVVMARQGCTGRTIAHSLSVSARTVRAWVQRYNKGGSAALHEQPGRGRRARLSQEQEERLCARLDAGAQPADGVCSLRGIDLVRVLQEEHGHRYSSSGVYRLLKRLGYSSLVPRPQHRKADGAAQTAFKKT